MWVSTVAKPNGTIRQLANVPRLDQQPEPVASIALLPGSTRYSDSTADAFQPMQGVSQQPGAGSLTDLEIGGIIHDFNNFLAIILSHTSIALSKLPADNPARSYLERAVRTTRRAADLSGQLLADIKNHRVEAAPLDLNQIIWELVELLTPKLGHQVELKLQLAPNLRHLLGNDVQFRQVILNLLVNALEAIEEAPGWITITTRNLTVPESRYIDVDALPIGDYVCLQVSDSGVGMDQVTLSRIFEPYFTTKLTGTGIGLSATLGIIQSHRGAIQVFSTPGFGSTFQLFLPTESLEEH
jgi:signal transduction histidine kinase